MASVRLSKDLHSRSRWSVLGGRRSRVVACVAILAVLAAVFHVGSTSHDHYEDLHAASNAFSGALERGRKVVGLDTTSDSCGTGSGDAYAQAALGDGDREDKTSWRYNATVFEHPTDKFRDNLWSDKRYITTWPKGGFANNVQEFFSIIYLAQLTDRIPVIPSFIRALDLISTENVYFGVIFDVPRLSKALRMPILEWRDIKNPESTEVEDLGCWSCDWATGPDFKPLPTAWKTEDVIGVDVSYSKVWGPAINPDPNDWTVKIWGLVALGFPAGHKHAVEENPKALPSRTGKKIMEPDQQMYCLDLIFYLGAMFQRDLFHEEYGPVWRFIGQHAHFHPLLIQQAKTMLRSAFGLEAGAEIPPYIAMHIRHGDFEEWCPKGTPPSECLSSPRAFSKRVEEIQNELRETRGLEVRHVLATSDAEDKFWAEVKQEGLDWSRVNHKEEMTRDIYGSWTPPVFDAIFHSMAIGFVGTEMSTFSQLGALRVKTWNNGLTRSVKWGKVGADDH